MSIWCNWKISIFFHWAEITPTFTTTPKLPHLQFFRAFSNSFCSLQWTPRDCRWPPQISTLANHPYGAMQHCYTGFPCIDKQGRRKKLKFVSLSKINTFLGYLAAHQQISNMYRVSGCGQRNRHEALECTADRHTDITRTRSSSGSWPTFHPAKRVESYSNMGDAGDFR